MVDYTAQARGSFLKRFARKVVLNPAVNRILVASVKAGGARSGGRLSRLPVVGRHAILRLPNNLTITLLDTERCQVAREVFWSGGQLAKPADRLALDAAIRLSRDAGLFLDIGAYTGLFALAVARVNEVTTAVTYEIVPENFISTWKNVFANDLVGRVVPSLIGLGAEAASIRIPATFEASPLASSVALDATDDDGIRIPVTTLDEQHANYTGRAVLKIDVETFEWPVLAGGRGFIERNRPDIICEVLRRAPDVPKLTSFLVEHDYCIYHITDEGLRQSRAIVPAAGERDWLFTTRTREELSKTGLLIA
jgi:FkbM family methyltransferase